MLSSGYMHVTYPRTFESPHPLYSYRHTWPPSLPLRPSHRPTNQMKSYMKAMTGVRTMNSYYLIRKDTHPPSPPTHPPSPPLPPTHLPFPSHPPHPSLPSHFLRYRTGRDETSPLDGTPGSDQVTEGVKFAYTLPVQSAGGEGQDDQLVADTEDVSVEQLAEQLKNL